MSKLAIWLIAICVSLILYWLLVEELGWSVWWVIIVGFCLMVIGALVAEKE